MAVNTVVCIKEEDVTLPPEERRGPLHTKVKGSRSPYDAGEGGSGAPRSLDHAHGSYATHLNLVKLIKCSSSLGAASHP